MGILPKVFGPFMWATIHYICLGAPATLNNEEKEAYKNFFNNLPAIMPCHSCGVHLYQNLKILPIDNNLNTKDDLFKWSVDLHNIVNKQLGKKEIDLNEAKQIWLQKIPSMNILSSSEIITVKDKKNIFFYLFIISIVIIILLLLVIVFRKREGRLRYRS